MSNQIQEQANKKKVLVFLCAAVLYVSVGSLFKWLISGVTITAATPAASFGPILGLFFGWPVILGSALGGFVFNIIFYKSVAYALVAVPIEILYAYIPYKLWYSLCGEESHEHRLDSARRAFRFLLVTFSASAAGGILIGLARHFILGFKFGLSIIISVFSYFDQCVLFGIPLMIVMSLIFNKVQSGENRFRNRSLVEKILLYTVLVEVIFIVLTIVLASSGALLNGAPAEWDSIYQFCIIAENVITFTGILIVAASIKKEKAIRKFHMIACIFSAILCIAAIVKINRIAILSVRSDLAASLGVSIAAMLIALFLYIVCVCDRHPVSRQSTWYMMLLLANVLISIVSCGVWVVTMRPDKVGMYITLKTLFYQLCLISYLCTFQFFKAGLKITKHQYKLVSRIVYLLLTAASAYVLSNPWTKLMFEISEEGLIVFNPISEIYTYIIVLMGILVFYILIKEKALLSEKVALGILIVLPLIGSYMPLSHAEFYLSDALNVCAVTFSFGIIYTKRSSELDEKHKDLHLAASVQESRLPKDFTIGKREYFDIYATMKPAREIGGDFYDFFELNDKMLAFGVADVSGKGSGAAIFMMRAITTIKNFATSGLHLAEAMTKSNESLHENNDALLFVTTWTGVLDYDSGVVKYVNAGHNYPYLIHPDGSVEQVVCKPDTMLAFFPGIEYHTHELQMKKGDILFLYTDGVTDTESDYEARFDEERLVKVLQSSASKADCRAICDAVKEELIEFMGHARQFDDITMLALKYNKA